MGRDPSSLLDPHAGVEVVSSCWCWTKPPARTFPSVARERPQHLSCRLLTRAPGEQRRRCLPLWGCPAQPSWLRPGTLGLQCGGGWGGWPGPPWSRQAPSSGQNGLASFKTPAGGGPAWVHRWGPEALPIPGPRKQDGSHPQDQAHREAGAKGVCVSLTPEKPKQTPKSRVLM